VIEDLKIYGLSISAIGTSIFHDINPILSSFVLIATLIYTVINIIDKLNKK
tara:strand:- start:583 stop:735 length:153 start_codon:yes stop_codon:yes gene_type:complete